MKKTDNKKLKISKTKTRIYYADKTHGELRKLIAELYHVDDESVVNMARTLYALIEEDHGKSKDSVGRLEMINLCMVSSILNGGAREFFDKSVHGVNKTVGLMVR